MHDDTRAECERNQVGHGVRRREEQRRVIIIRFKVETVVGGEHACDVVDLPEFVIWHITGDGEVGEFPRLEDTVRAGIRVVGMETYI
jgi:hypothetical protein